MKFLLLIILLNKSPLGGAYRVDLSMQAFNTKPACMAIGKQAAAMVESEVSGLQISWSCIHVRDL